MHEKDEQLINETNEGARQFIEQAMKEGKIFKNEDGTFIQMEFLIERLKFTIVSYFMMELMGDKDAQEAQSFMSNSRIVIDVIESMRNVAHGHDAIKKE